MTLHSFLLRWGLDKEVKSAMGWERLDKPEICSFPDFIQRSPTKSLQDSVAAPTGKEANVLFFASRPPPSVEFPSSSFSLHSLLTQSQMPPNYPWVVQNCSFCSGLETSVILMVSLILKWSFPPCQQNAPLWGTLGYWILM